MKTEIVPEKKTEVVTRVVEKDPIDIQISTAKRYPRDVAKFQKDALTMATLDETAAGECFYTMPRAGKNITGPSVRLAEIVYSAWGNMHSGTRLKEVSEKHVHCESVVWDLERNVRHSEEVARRITKKDGRRFNDDMIATTGAAGRSIAFRDAIFRVVPRGIWKTVEMAARKVIAGDEKTLVKRREMAMKIFVKEKGVSEERVLFRLGRQGVDAITVNDLVVLRGVLTALKDGATTLEEAFPMPGVKESKDIKSMASFLDSKEPTEEEVDAAFAKDDSIRQPGEEG